MNMRTIPAHQGHQFGVAADVGFCLTSFFPPAGICCCGVNDLYLCHFVGGGEAKRIVKRSSSVFQSDIDQSRDLVSMMTAASSAIFAEFLGDIPKGRRKGKIESRERHPCQVRHGRVIEKMEGEHRP
jgi:hypothetical protein